MTVSADEELEAWLDEFHRLVIEAEERVAAGHLRPALASLAAIPAVHKQVAERCLKQLENQAPDEEADQAVGLYL